MTPIQSLARARTAFSPAADSAAACRDLHDQLGDGAYPAVVFFCAPEHDGRAISAELTRRYPDAEVVGCTTAGEFAGDRHGIGGVSAIALTGRVVTRAAAAVARLGENAAAEVTRAAHALGEAFGTPLRELDPARHVGIVLVDGLGGHEEEVNVALGNAAPMLSFVGGSAGDNLAFRETRVFHNGEEAAAGAVLLLLEAAVPFHVMKTCSFAPTDTRFTITRADAATRTVYEVNGRPVLEAYAEALGTTPDRLDGAVFMRHPVGLMLDGDPWIRSPQQITPDGGLKFYCQILPGMEVTIMNGTDLVGDTATAVRDGAAQLGAPVGAAVLFNCILRRLELDATDAHAGFLAAFAGFPTAGFHTYGESWLGHINQTCTGILFA